MKKTAFFISSILLVAAIWVLYNKFIEHPDYRRDSRHFFCMGNGHCITMWRTRSGICYVIPGKYSGLSRPTSGSYITSPFTRSMDIIWPKNTDNIIVNLEDPKSQIIHKSPNGINIISYNVNKKYNDIVFLYYDGSYYRFKKSVDFMSLDIKEEHANSKNVITDTK
jgi:hypothetical protein